MVTPNPLVLVTDGALSFGTWYGAKIFVDRVFEDQHGPSPVSQAPLGGAFRTRQVSFLVPALNGNWDQVLDDDAQLKEAVLARNGQVVVHPAIRAGALERVLFWQVSEPWMSVGRTLLRYWMHSTLKAHTTRSYYERVGQNITVSISCVLYPRP